MNIGTSPMNESAEQKALSSLYERWCRFVNRARCAVSFLVPFGYEDEEGFHYGTAPVDFEMERE